MERHVPVEETTSVETTSVKTTSVARGHGLLSFRIAISMNIVCARLLPLDLRLTGAMVDELVCMLVNGTVAREWTELAYGIGGDDATVCSVVAALRRLLVSCVVVKGSFGRRHVHALV